MANWSLAENRGLIEVGGPEAEPFLQGLISNDVTKANASGAIYAALLTPQGKFLHDFFIVRIGETLFLDCEAERRQDLFQRLRRYRLRSKVELADRTDEWQVAVVWGENARAPFAFDPGSVQADLPGGGVAYADPRHQDLGVRLIMPRGGTVPALEGMATGDLADLERYRLALGVPEGSRDLAVEKAFLLESGFDELHGIDWRKGCYVGQEVTARTKYRGLVRRRLTPVAISGGEPAEDGQITADGRNVGELRTIAGDVGLALLRLDALDSGKELVCGGASLTATVPDWWELPKAEAGTTAATS